MGKLQLLKKFASKIGLEPIYSTNDPDGNPATLGEEAAQILRDNFEKLENDLHTRANIEFVETELNKKGEEIKSLSNPFQSSKNALNPYALGWDYIAYFGYNGMTVIHADYNQSICPPIPITAGKKLLAYSFSPSSKSYLLSYGRVVWYDDTDKPMSYTNSPEVPIAPANTAYCRVAFSGRTPEEMKGRYVAVVDADTEFTDADFTEFYQENKNLIIKEYNIDKNAVSGEKIKDKAISARKLQFLKTGKNILDESLASKVEGYAFGNNGIPYPNESYCYLEDYYDFNVEQITSNCGFMLYDKYKNAIQLISLSSGIATVKKEDSPLIAYYRVNYALTNKNPVVIEGTPDDFINEVYKTTIPSLDVTENKVVADIKNIAGNTVKALFESIDSKIGSGNNSTSVVSSLFALPKKDLTVAVVHSDESGIGTGSAIPNPVQFNSCAAGGISPLFRYSYPELSYVLTAPGPRVSSNMARNLGMTIEFYCNSRYLELKGGASYRATVLADKLIISEKLLTPSTGGLRYILIDFGTKKKRYIKLGWYGTFGGVNTEQGGEVTPYLVNRPFYISEGDSITEGAMGATTSDNPIYSYPAIIAQKLGFDTYNTAVGGSGYIKPGNQGEPNMLDRFDTYVKQYNPKVFTASGGFNDGVSDLVTLENNINEYWYRVRTELPDTYSIAISPPALTNPAPQNLQTIGELVRIAARNNRIPYIDILNSKTYDSLGNLVTDNTNGYLGSLITAENKPYYISSDNVHPTQEGYRYIGLRIANEMFKLLKGNAGYLVDELIYRG